MIVWVNIATGGLGTQVDVVHLRGPGEGVLSYIFGATGVAGGEELGDFDHEGLTSSTKGFLKDYGEDFRNYLKAKQQMAIKQHENSCLSKV